MNFKSITNNFFTIQSPTWLSSTLSQANYTREGGTVIDELRTGTAPQPGLMIPRQGSDSCSFSSRVMPHLTKIWILQRETFRTFNIYSLLRFLTSAKAIYRVFFTEYGILLGLQSLQNVFFLIMRVWFRDLYGSMHHSFVCLEKIQIDRSISAFITLFVLDLGKWVRQVLSQIYNKFIILK